MKAIPILMGICGLSIVMHYAGLGVALGVFLMLWAHNLDGNFP